MVARRQGHHRRRVHRPRDARPALVGRPAPGGRGQGGRRRSRKRTRRWRRSRFRTSSALQEAGGHDRHRRHRGRGVPQDLQARRQVDPDQQADRARQTPTTSSTRPSARSSARSSTRSSTATSTASRCWSARPASRRRKRRVACCRRRASSTTSSTPSSTSSEAYIVAQAGRKGAVTISTNMAGRGTDIILGGNPEMMRALEVDPRERRRACARRRRRSEAFQKLVDAVQGARAKPRSEEVRRPRAACTSSAPSATSRAASTTSCAAAPAARATRARSRFYLSLEDDLMRIFAGERVKSLMERLGMEEDEPIEHPWVDQERSRTRRRRSRSATSTSARTCSSTTT